MTPLVVDANLGTEALEGLVINMLKAFKLDKDGDGKVTRAEIFQSLSELAPQFFNITDSVAEVRDLTISEFNHLCNVAALNLPDYPNVRAEAETVVVAALKVLGAGAELVAAITKLNATKPVPTSTAVEAAPAKKK